MDETVGKILREKRESLCLTVDEVAEKTSLRAEYLEKIENDDFSVFRTPIYAKGTIRGYANFLGLDGLALVEQFKKNQQAGVIFASVDIGQDTIDAVTKSKVKANLIQHQGVGTQTSFSKDGKSLPIGQIVFGFVLAGLIAGGCYFAPDLKFDKVDFSFVDGFTTKITELYGTVINLVSESRQEKQDANKNASRKDSAAGLDQKLNGNSDGKGKEKAAAVSKTVTKKAEVKVDKNAIAPRYDKVVVEMTASGQCWIDVFADGKAIYSGMMTKGRYKIFEANRRVTVRYGNIGVMQVIVNGKPVNMRGEAGVTTRHYPK